MKNKPFTPVKSADRVFDILEALVKHSDGLHIRELGKKLNIADSSIHALVHTMLQRRYLKMDESRKLFFGLQILSIFQYDVCHSFSSDSQAHYEANQKQI